MTVVLFFVFAALALASALGVVLARNPVHSALLLVVTLVSVAVFFIMQDADLLAAVQIIVYAGAIVVLFLFVIMLLGVDRREAMHEPLPYQRVTALALGAIVLAEVIFLGGHQWATGATATGNNTITGGSAVGGNVERVARALFTDFLWPFEITAALLVLAVVGSVVLARRSGQPVEDAIEEPR
ncbi:MAG TPA: NADH-quinone oxidoreductase subunit J [Acidimicrobiia bacterium]|nr:NADH-quinone oxidoreductase subunit J [Acidimicrobiia bacterium]